MFAALAAHDDLIAKKGVDVWIGGEPTFTRADSFDLAWASAAEGDDKLARAHALATELADQLPGASVSRVVGAVGSAASEMPVSSSRANSPARTGQLKKWP